MFIKKERKGNMFDISLDKELEGRVDKITLIIKLYFVVYCINTVYKIFFKK